MKPDLETHRKIIRTETRTAPRSTHAKNVFRFLTTALPAKQREKEKKTEKRATCRGRRMSSWNEKVYKNTINALTLP